MKMTRTISLSAALLIAAAALTGCSGTESTGSSDNGASYGDSSDADNAGAAANNTDSSAAQTPDNTEAKKGLTTDITVTFKEFELLCLLLDNIGTVLSREKIISKVWGYDFDGESRTVDVHIRTLRMKLGSCGSMIETVRGIGYKAVEAGQSH